MYYNKVVLFPSVNGVMFFTSSTIAVDDFTARLYKIHQQILKEGRSQVCGSATFELFVSRIRFFLDLF